MILPVVDSDICRLIIVKEHYDDLTETYIVTLVKRVHFFILFGNQDLRV